jgi:hypothetical protein
MLARAADRLLDWFWDATLAVSTDCPVCAFWRGIFLGILGVFVAGWLL